MSAQEPNKSLAVKKAFHGQFRYFIASFPQLRMVIKIKPELSGSKETEMVLKILSRGNKCQAVKKASS
jgi:hypothetical protein